MSEAAELERCVAVGGVVVFPADTVYGLACDPENRFAVQRLYLLKRRPLSKPSAVMFFDLDAALAALPELGDHTREAMCRLLPGPVTVLVANPAGRFPLACGAQSSTLGIRVPRVALLSDVRRPLLQSSANRAGGDDPRQVGEIPELLRAAADLIIDAGELPGTPSTVIDLRHYDVDGSWSTVRVGEIGYGELGDALGGQYHFHPDTYKAMIEADLPAYQTLQDELVRASGRGARRILELGTGTGETTRRLLERHPDASLVGVDASAEMLSAAREGLPPGRVDLRLARLEEPLPDGQFDLVASALSVHHLDGPAKAELFDRVRAALVPGGRLVLADVIWPADPAVATAPLTPGFDLPSSVADQLEWLDRAGFDARVTWEAGDLAVISADAR